MFGLICHCSNCKKLSGSQMMCASVYSKSHFTVNKGEPAQYADTQTDSGKPATRYFCPKCGSQLYCTMAFNEKLVIVFSGSLDEEFSRKWKPNKEQYLCRKTDSLPDFRIVEKAGLPMKHRKGPFGF
ncbi:uncharacterized protein RAG0_17521 [Rhynchosporium agropyri]|uniref:CENP-V/GFA domain-containing protein n=2 Tax=Rhynchosporium TaxID=38037 RepID=A0A1E1LTU6_9HELO|nr:uncharacterized protein RAG0_17521 [Rhynchosporium agropyri]